MAQLRTITLLALALGFVGLAGAQTLDMDGTQPAMESAGPTRGMTQASVESKFGTPTSRDAEIGDPPISRWEYPEFVVFFEFDRVIHSVKKR